MLMKYRQEEMEQLAEYITGGNAQTAECLSEEIIRLARAGSFHEAEKLHAYLLDCHPMALAIVISTAEIIEEQKSLKIDQEHLAIWNLLYSRLSSEERNCLFYSTDTITVPAGKMIIRQGTPNPRLLFVESGRITLFHTREKMRVLVGQLSSGCILGEETFFNHSTPTLSAGSETEVKLRYLDKAKALDWDEKQPGLLEKIADYCLQNCRSAELLQRKNIEKRVFPRVKAEGKARVYPLGADGARTGEYLRGSLIDISRNGVSFDIHSSKAQNAQALLGKKLDIEMDFTGAEITGPLKNGGTIVKVGALLHNDYSVHVRLRTVLSREDLRTYVQPFRNKV
jgi:CRP-like cAMP-binding protein